MISELHSKIFLKTISNIFALAFILLFISCKKIEREAKVITKTVSEITATSAKATGDIIDLGNGITAYGHCWSLATNPTISDSKTSLGPVANTGIISSELQNLETGKTYHVKAYVKSGKNIIYGTEVSFITTQIIVATLTTTAVSSITLITAISGGNITTDGGGAITARGTCWATAANPTITDSETTDGTGTGTFTSNLTGLAAGTTYHVRAYATNNAGTAYGNDVSFTTNPVVFASISTTTITSITQTTAVSGGIITSDGGGSITVRGVCWSTTTNPTISNSKTTDGTGIGSYISNLSGLVPSTTYHVRAYATNNAGTAYGNDFSFTTNPVVLATISTTSVTSITQTTVVSGGNIAADGGGAVTARGVCWATTTNPTINDSKTTDGTGAGSFTSNLTVLSTNTIFYIRAYAINSAGASYGNEVSFTLWINQLGPQVNDFDGNIYNSVKIGNQVWMKENLKTTKYNDGSSIPNVTDNVTWAGLTSPGYCWYNNDAATYKATYGALYNWYAVDAASNGGKNVCPIGWHAPNDAEWTILTTYLGGESVAGGKLKETGTTHWLSPNTGATNESGFTALPGGTRYIDYGSFYNIGERVISWSTTLPYSCSIWFDQNNVIRDIFGQPEYGFSVRCVKD